MLKYLFGNPNQMFKCDVYSRTFLVYEIYYALGRDVPDRKQCDAIFIYRLVRDIDGEEFLTINLIFVIRSQLNKFPDLRCYLN